MSLTALLSITILTSVIAISDISPAFADPVLNPENGHYYQYVSGVHITCTDAKIAAENSTYNGISGHLVTITSQSENEFVHTFLPLYAPPWIGLSDETTEGTYQWVTGETFSYSACGGYAPVVDADKDYFIALKNSRCTNNIWTNVENYYTTITRYIVE